MTDLPYHSIFNLPFQAIWTFISTLAAAIYTRVSNKANEISRLLPLEIFNLIVMATAFIAAAIFAVQLDRLCLPLEEFWPVVKVALSVVAPQISDIFDSCPISMAGATLTGLVV